MSCSLYLKTAESCWQHLKGMVWTWAPWAGMKAHLCCRGLDAVRKLAWQVWGLVDFCSTNRSCAVISEQRDTEQAKQNCEVFLLRWMSPRRGWGCWGLRECFLVAEIQVPIPLASAWLEWAQPAPCHRVRGPNQVSSPCSGACGSLCCFLRWAGRFLRRILL